MNKLKTISRLHFITHPMEGFSPEEQARQVLEGGGDWVQLRMKKHQPEQIRAEAEKIMALKAQFKFTLIINDNPELAKRCGADGVHLGKQDCSPAEARQLLGSDFIIGGTANTIEDVERLAAQGVDYIGLGPFRFTSTKENLSPVLAAEGYQAILNAMKVRGINLPVIGIGGIQLGDIPELMATGLHGLAASSSLLKSPSTAESTTFWLNSIEIQTARVSAYQPK